MAQRLAPAAVPVFVAAHRAGAARALLLAYPQTQIVVCDDGLQHRQLSRDVEITVFDERGIGNGWPLPAGPLREPWPPLMESAYKGDRPIAIGLHTGATRALNLPGWDAKRSLAGEAYNAAGERRALSSFGAAADGEPALAEPRVKREANSEANSKANTVQTVAVAGIARPQAFFDMLREQGVALDATAALADHCSFESTNTTVNPRQTLICTEKDAVKLWKTHPAAWAVPLHLTPESGFFDVLDAAVDGLLAVKVAE